MDNYFKISTSMKVQDAFGVSEGIQNVSTHGHPITSLV